MNIYTLKSEDLSQAFLLSEIKNLPAGNYQVFENNGIKHHHHIIVQDPDAMEIFYLTAFDRFHDNELTEALEEAYLGDVHQCAVSRHESTFRKYVK